jgi:hypothetical protein
MKVVDKRYAFELTKSALLPFYVFGVCKRNTKQKRCIKNVHLLPHSDISRGNFNRNIYNLLRQNNIHNIQRNTCRYGVMDKKCLNNQVRRMVGAAVAAAVGRLNLEASGNITKIRVANSDPH